MADHFWLSDAQWAVIEPHIPRVYTGKRRVDDRRVISGTCIGYARGVAGGLFRTSMGPIRRCSIATIAGASGVCGSGSWRRSARRPPRR